MQLRPRHNREEGFTLIELLVVIIIIGILTAIAIPLYYQYQGNAQKTAMRSDVKATVVNVERYLNIRPGATATELNDSANVSKVYSTKGGSETITILGDWSNYQVKAQNISRFGSGSVYTYDSVTGKLQGTGQFAN